MPEVSIGLTTAGRNRTVLSANVGNELQVNWDLTDGQLMHLVAQGVSILEDRHRMSVMGDVENRMKLIGMLKP